MSGQFIGLTMLVTLSSPEGAQLRGTVSSIEPGKSLTLRNVTCPSNGKYVPEFTINAAEIVELVEAGNENAISSTAVPPPVPIPPEVPMPPARQNFEDPAILSMGKRPPLADRASVSSNHNSTSMNRTDSARTGTTRDGSVRKGVTPDITLVEPMRNTGVANGQEQGIEEQTLEEILDDAEAEASAPTKPRRSRRRRGQGRRTNDDPILDPEITPAKETTRSKGWRQTPLLEPNPSFQPFSTLKRGKKDKRVEQNGWQTEDATDVQDMGDFDFAGSLAKFDKSSIFKQMQAEDGILDEDRLVAHNRLPKAKPGTAGGKNLHYTENVLDTPNSGSKVKKEDWQSEAGESEPEERASQRDTGSGRVSQSRLALNRRPVSRKGSGGPGAVAQPIRSLSVPATGKASFYLVPSDRRCEPISALQMLNLENIADNDLGLSEDMMTENAGRGIAEVALSALNTGGRGLTQGKSNIVPTVVVFAGNNKSGLRALAAGRHLKNHGINAVACVLGLERESELLVGLRRQLKVFRGFGGKVLSKAELQEHIKTTNVPDLIIDGLLGLTISFEELRTGDQATAYELIEWANRSKASVLTIDVPTGIDPTTGKVSIIDGRRLYIHAKYVVAMGAPKKGLIEAMILGEGVSDEDNLDKGKEWQLFVADLGLGAAVWKKAGTRVRRGVEFEGSWVLGMRFQGTAE